MQQVPAPTVHFQCPEIVRSWSGREKGSQHDSDPRIEWSGTAEWSEHESDSRKKWSEHDSDREQKCPEHDSGQWSRTEKWPGHGASTEKGSGDNLIN